MKILLKTPIKMIDKSNNLSKSNISKNLRNLKLISNYSQKRKLPNEKINLKFRNSYKYDFNNIMNRTYRSTINKIKKSEPNYSTFYSKTTNYLDSDFLSPILYSPDKIKTEKLYTRIFSANTDYTDNRIRSSTTRFRNSRNNSSNRTKNFRKINLNDTYVDFNKDIYDKILKKKKKESLLHFVESNKLVRKQKIINYFLENKYKESKEKIEEKKKEVLIENNSKTRNLFLFKNYSYTADKYLEKLYIDKINKKQENEELKLKKLLLEDEIDKIKNKLNKIKAQLFKLISAKEIILFIIDIDIEKMKLSNESNIILLKKNLDEKIQSSYDQILSKYNKKIISKSMIQDFKKNNKLNKSFTKKQTFKKSYSNTKKFAKKNKSFIKMGTEMNFNINIPRRNEKKSLIIESKIDFSIFDNISDFKDKFKKLEMNIFGDLKYLFGKRLDVSNLQNRIEKPKIEEHEDNQESSKIMLLDYLKNKNKILNNQLETIKNIKYKEKKFNKILHKKLFNILLDINQNVSITKKIELNNIIHDLNKDSKYYNKKIHISKTLYIIKAIESTYLFYSLFIKRYRENIDNNKKYLNILSKMKKEKEVLNFKASKIKIENRKIEREKNIMKKSCKIYITSQMKYNMKLLIKNKKNKKMQPIEEKEDSFEQFITYS